MGNPLV